MREVYYTLIIKSRVWDTATGQCLRTLVHEDNAPVSSVRFSPNGKFLLAWTLDSCVRLWNYVEGRCVKTYQGHKNVKYSISGTFGLYGDGKQAFVASGSEDGSIVLWDVTSKEILQKIEGHEGVVLGCETREDLLVSGGGDGTVRVWTTADDHISQQDDGAMEQ
jgi:COMPASS component SWD3